MSRLLADLSVFGLCVLCAGGCASTQPATPDRPAAPQTADASPAPDSVARKAGGAASSRTASDGDATAREARLLYGDAKYGRLIARFGERVCDGSVAPDVGYWVARAHQTRRDHDAALTVLRCVRDRMDAPSQRVLRAAGDSHAATYDLSRATEAYRGVLARDSSAHDVRWSLADVYRKQEDWKAACTQYTALRDAGFDSARLHTALGICNTNLGRLGLAIDHLQTAYQKQPGNVDVALRLSELVEITRSPDAASELLQAALEARPHSARLWWRAGSLALKRKQYPEAVGAFERTIAEGDTSVAVYQRLGIAYVGAQQPAAALPPLRRAYQRDSMRVATAFYLGSAYRGVDSLGLAARYFQRTIDLGTQGRVVDAFSQLASVEGDRGNLSRAVRAYKTALRLQPERRDLYFYLATLYDANYKDKTVAAQYYEMYLSDTTATADNLQAYAERRLRDLKPTLHFQRGRSGASADTSVE